MSAGAPPPVLFGKLPDRADFVRKGGSSPALDALDTVTQRALWPALPVADGPLYRFVYNPPAGPHALVGALKLSHDRIGRQYPLIAGRPVERAALDPAAAPSWPLRWAAVHDAAADVVGPAVAGLVPFDASATAAMRMPEAAWGADRSPEVDRHVEAADALLALDLFRRFPGGEARVFQMLTYLTHLLRKGSLPGYGLDLPLPAPAADFGRADGVAFWLAAGAHVMRARAPWPSLFWRDGAERRPGRLYVFYSRLASQAFRFVLNATPDPDTVLALDAPPPPSVLPALKAALPSVQRLLADPRLSVADVLVRLHTLH